MTHIEAIDRAILTLVRAQQRIADYRSNGLLLGSRGEALEHLQEVAGESAARHIFANIIAGHIANGDDIN